MKYYYLDEHLSCINHDAGENPMLNILELNADQTISCDSLYNKLILVVRGKISYSYSIYGDVEVEEKNLFFLPSGYKTELKIIEDSQLIFFQINILRQLCDKCQLEQLLDVDCEIDTDKPYILPFNERVLTFVNSLLIYYGDGLRCYYFYDRYRRLDRPC